MTPNKIYFPADGLPRYIDWDGSPIRTKQVDDSDICYIRKDLLLEWAKEQSASCDGSVAMKRAYDKLIEKLNTL